MGYQSGLKGFEIMLGLGINYHKSKLIGININPRFMDLATLFLACKVEPSSFKFFGIIIGSNPRRSTYWTHLVENLRNRLSLWKSRWVSFRGRITLIKWC